MTTGDLVNIHPTELKFPFELKKQSSCSMQLTNKTTTHCVAFKVKTTNPRKYCVRPNTGVVLPGDSCNVTDNLNNNTSFLSVTMQAQKEAPLDMQCKDKFLVQTVVVSDGTSSKEVLAEMFNKEAGRVIEDFKLRVVYIPANPPSPVPEGSEEGNSPMASLNEIGSQTASLFDDVSRTFEETNEKSSEAWSMISKLTEEKTSATQQSQKLRLELEMLRKESSKKQSGGHSLVLMLLVGLLGCVIGYILNRINSFKINLMGISKALRSLLILLLLNMTFIFGHVIPGATVKPCPPSPTKCPRDTLKFGVCGSWLGLVREVIGTPPSQECCSLIKGLADFEAAVCLCTALKTSILGIAPVKIPVALSLLLNSCGKNVPQGFVC
ncbi:hypothetical protein ARALYDRAFT_327754 [Arabidopsis lyrata subsp. lyrata]|uniref:MSP domain-containing protein n=2 Tax=Arabidopsis lyrata subsp. lyrata TaxID=81972 RepID=D7M5S1_ARALL|nr:hypothetical protein ARALYDRAFT_327754 [Arabidopsis lyrata subsp. lyrata]